MKYEDLFKIKPLVLVIIYLLILHSQLYRRLGKDQEICLKRDGFYVRFIR